MSIQQSINQAVSLGTLLYTQSGAYKERQELISLGRKEKELRKKRHYERSMGNELGAFETGAEIVETKARQKKPLSEGESALHIAYSQGYRGDQLAGRTAKILSVRRKINERNAFNEVMKEAERKTKEALENATRGERK